MAQTETKVLTAHVPLPLAEKVDQMAARLERSRGWIMKQALSAWIAQEEERDRLTHEALADVDAGRVIAFGAHEEQLPGALSPSADFVGGPLRLVPFVSAAVVRGHDRRTSLRGVPTRAGPGPPAFGASRALVARGTGHLRHFSEDV